MVYQPIGKRRGESLRTRRALNHSSRTHRLVVPKCEVINQKVDHEPKGHRNCHQLARAIDNFRSSEDGSQAESGKDDEGSTEQGAGTRSHLRILNRAEELGKALGYPGGYNTNGISPGVW